MIQLPLTYPSSPGYKRRGTSSAAARSVKSKAEVLREKVLRVIAECARTADEAAAALGESVLSVRPRVSELQAQGRIRDSGRRGKSISGKSAIVWEIL